MDFTTIRHELEDGILTVVLDRPDNLNAFTVEMADELERTFVAVNDDDAVRAVIVTGEGRAFCAGMDLSSEGNVFGLDESKTPSLADMADLDDPELRRVRDTGGRVTLAIYACRKPVIAAINGAAVGIGATMTLAMDARLMSSKARFGLVFGKLGITPEACSTWFLPRIVGMPTALDLVYRSDILTADTAHEIGLVQSVHEPDALITEARALADAWTRDRSPVSVALMRQMLYRNSAEPHPVDAHRVDSLAMFYTSIGDGHDGVRAFLEKRTPEFTGQASEMPPFYEEWVSGDRPR
ncbi:MULTISPECIES: crotonase/enoyl-CoA hydratase family protein [Mycolicibacterium]|uniref:Enoyl-CoA hydratase n=2 Tax=Mycolicibacterium fortuitum TaxID=1766 RepID=A0A378V2F1_MYCFO|nr:crotonase/enoyl-CoA hydratase family protein [Mycolicibacterium fortuitum]AIY44572.1 Enoyl-CoA hydratase [Mycobacterium sp. VKM Ac-1817D]CRL80689.1 enoyl-CoA hydratase [Mycolicibacter nonchromogenicus]AMD53690.1 enoyl-CoA hydratase [Mycolicibacterium fortuitum subsp. fortuitum DSM 46621 = ATCC 6841 = JCM 6387]EJZ15590.1 enoyl-CoA hydratase [Mycolicibacterium fortuitum subsp. fortuitum DSM 46621 = ATCC 6841 = JCM 6387]MDG5770509.1 crotonase/enoyl-CoA hydratase family protein [Mycolicibacteri